MAPDRADLDADFRQHPVAHRRFALGHSLHDLARDVARWARLGQRLALDSRLACGDEVLPPAVVVDSRSLTSLGPDRLRAGHRRRQAGQGHQSFAVCDKHGSLLDLELHPANTDDWPGILPMLPRLAALEHDIHVSVSPGGTRDGHFLPTGIRWVVERLFAWMSRYRRLIIVYNRAPDLFAAHI